MNRKGDLYDNAVAEKTFGSLDVELVSHARHSPRDEARRTGWLPEPRRLRVGAVILLTRGP